MHKVALAAALALALAGCADSGSKQLSQEEAHVVATDALAAFARDFAAADGGHLRAVRGDFAMQATGLAGDVEFEIEWGTQQRTRIALSAAGSGQSIDAQVFCTLDRVVFVWGEQRYERRAVHGSCLQALQDSQDPLSIAELGGDTIQRVDPHRDGSVTAYISKDGSNVTAQIDARGRLDRIDFSGDGGSGALRIEYGQRKSITVPDATQRIPAAVEGSGRFTNDQYEWHAHAATHSVPLNEIEVRMMDASGGLAAAFTLQTGTQTASGFALTFTDDGDGRFGQGDRFVVVGDAWTSADQYDVVVWDTWADAEVGDFQVPGLPWLALLGVLAVAARRQ